MNKINEFIKRHKVISIIILSILGLALLDGLLTGDFESFKNMLFPLLMMIVYIIILSFMISKKKFFCPECNTKLNKDVSFCPNCGHEFSGESKPVSKRVYYVSKLLFLIGEAIIAIPLGLGFLYLLFSPLVAATSNESITISNTIFAFYTKSNLLPTTIVITFIGLIFIFIGFIFKKKGK